MPVGPNLSSNTFRPWNDNHRPATPAVPATENEVPSPRSTSKTNLEPFFVVNARQTAAPGAVMSTAGPRHDPDHSLSSTVLAATAMTSSNAAGKTTNSTRL